MLLFTWWFNSNWIQLIFDFFRGKKLSRSKFRLVNMTLKGYGILDNLTLSTSDHSGMFYSSADWLVRHQDHKGGWPIQVRRKMASGLIDLAPGWYSAMGQGQAMSLLMRAFNRSGHYFTHNSLLGPFFCHYLIKNYKKKIIKIKINWLKITKKN